MDQEGEKPRDGQVPINDNSATVPPEPARSTSDYANYAPPPKPSRFPSQSKRWLVWAAVLIAIFAVLALGYKFFTKDTSTAPTPEQAQNSQAASAPKSQITSATKNYSSQNFALSFDHPQDWTVTDAGSGIMTVKSPALNFTEPASEIIVVLTFRNKTQKLAEFDAGNAIAARDSTKIAYAKPSQAQRADTYLSFLRYAKSTSGMDGVYITGNSGYKAAQAVPKVDIEKVEPVINITFEKKAADGKAVQVQIPEAVWDDPGFSTPVLNMLKSLVIT